MAVWEAAKQGLLHLRLNPPSCIATVYTFADLYL